MTDVMPASGQPGNDLRRRRLHRGFIALSVVSALILITLGVGNWYANRAVSNLHQAGNHITAALPSDAPVVKGKGHLVAKPKTGQPFTVLILGTDSRAGTTAYGSDSAACGCSDTIILARVNPQTEKVSLLSIPRDSRVNVVGSKVNPTKINSAFGRGPDNSVATIEQALQIPINHWIVLDLAGFKSIVDAIGGIKMDFPELITDKNAGLYITQTGCQSINGTTALAISRSRELKYLDPKTGKYVFDPTYEYGRARREQILMKVIAAHTVKRSLSNPLTAHAVISTFTSNDRLAVDNQVTSSELLQLGVDFAGFDASAMQTFTLPTYTSRLPAPGAPNGLDFEILEPDKDIATIQAWYDATLATPKATKTTAPATTATPATTDAAVAPTTTRGSKTTSPAFVPTTTAAAPTTTAGAAPTTTAPVISPNEPQPWDPRPCS